MGKALRPVIALTPLLAFMGIFFFSPIAAVIVDSFHDNSGEFSLINYVDVLREPIKTALITSFGLALVSALTASIPGAILAFLIESRGSQRLRQLIASIAGVLANTGGVPLAFMFIAALGAEGAATSFLKALGFDLYSTGFSLYSFWGLVVVYSYFQIPMMVIVFSPAIHGLRREWSEAARTLGATTAQFWTRIGIPLLFPSFFSSFLLLFASAFSAYATARAMTNGTIPLVPLMIGNLLDGNVIFDEVNLAKALAVAMVLVTLAAMVPYLVIQRRAERWQK
ncbi:MAG: ABC transporter permease subunit [Actinomycetales bacterium]|nr:ABC transporter permease subunit [Actinomycetales bacterium]